MRLELDEAATRKIRGDRKLGGQLEPDRIRVPVAQPQQTVLEVVAEVVALDTLAPALLEQAGGRRGLARATSPRDRLEVLKDALRAVVHLVAELPQAHAQIRVLEAVPELDV